MSRFVGFAFVGGLLLVVLPGCVDNDVKTGSSVVNNNGGDTGPEAQTLACMSDPTAATMCMEFTYYTDDQKGELEAFCAGGAGFPGQSAWVVVTTCPTTNVYAMCVNTGYLGFDDGEPAQSDVVFYEGICAAAPGLDLESECVTYFVGTYEGPEGACVEWEG